MNDFLFIFKRINTCTTNDSIFNTFNQHICINDLSTRCIDN